MSNLELSDQELQRRETLTKLREYGIDPYPAALYPVTDKAKQIKEKYEEDKQVVIAGRLMRRKIQGKLPLEIYKMTQGESRCTLTVMKFVQEKTNHFTMMYLKKYLI